MDDSGDSILSFHIESLNYSFSPATPSFKLNAARSLFGEEEVNDHESSLHSLNQIISKFPVIFSSPTLFPINNKPIKSPHLQPLHSSPIINNAISINKSSHTASKSFSDTWMDSPLKQALNQAYESPDLIADFSKNYALPTLLGNKNPELKAVKCETVKHLLENKYSSTVKNFSIIDCRFPYEYEGGHIKNAINIYTREGIIEYFFKNPIFQSSCDKPSNPKNFKFNNLNDNKGYIKTANLELNHNIIIFHCEFSQERGPKLYQFMRNYDRQINKEQYPKLYYPEVYILEGGYKLFYENFLHLCIPQNYKPMLHNDHKNDLKHFKAKSKSWGGEKNNPIARPCIKKRNLFR
ncbi:unnamed protein product [Gordionus sp. m RMFG-2023]|uniref:M-phase inducer phosphatase-like n=1 Tax=Gordionus sp. m RMFG-2023 TaxID=3053472 RepID=UPI0030E54ED6